LCKTADSHSNPRQGGVPAEVGAVGVPIEALAVLLQAAGLLAVASLVVVLSHHKCVQTSDSGEPREPLFDMLGATVKLLCR
jgi:hypothetical protein